MKRHISTPIAGARAALLAAAILLGLPIAAEARTALAELRVDKLVPSTDEAPERLELGTLPYELLAGTTAAVGYLAGLASQADDRRTRVLASMEALEEHESELFGRLLDGLGAVPGVQLHGAPARRTPTAFFSVAGRSRRWRRLRSSSR